jgi:predicted nucleotidyltransferase
VERFVSSLTLRDTKEFGSRYFGSNEELSDWDVGLLVKEDDFFRPAERGGV